MFRFSEKTLLCIGSGKEGNVLVKFTGQTTGEPRFRQLVAGLSHRTGFYLRLIYAGFVADKTALGHVLLRTLQCVSFLTIPPMFHIHIFIYQRHHVTLATNSEVKYNTFLSLSV